MQGLNAAMRIKFWGPRRQTDPLLLVLVRPAELSSLISTVFAIT